MSQNKYIVNSFEGGLNSDLHPDSVGNKTYDYALNIVNKDHNQITYLSNEHSTEESADFGQTIVGASYINDRNKTLIFLQNGELWLFDHKTKKKEFVASDTEFGCEWGFKDCEWMYAEFKTMQPCSELHAYWSSGCIYYSINIDEMLDKKRKEALKEEIKEEQRQCSDKTCDYFKIFKCHTFPKVSPIAHESGGELGGGAYQFVVRLIDRDGNSTNWFNISDPVYIPTDHNQANERGTGLIEVNISCLDCRYDKLELAVIKTISGVTTADLLTEGSYNANSFNYTYYGNESNPIELSEILIKRNTFIQGRDLIQKDGRLYLYSIKQLNNLDYQRRANNIATTVVEYEYPYEDVKKFNLKSFMRGETYAFGIVWNYCDGTHTPVFHIPSNTSSGGGGDATYVDSPNTQSPTASANTSSDSPYHRQRTPKEDTVADPQHDEYDDILEQELAAWETEVDDICEALSDCEECPKGEQQCNADKDKLDSIANNFEDIISSYTNELDGGLTIDFSSATKIKESARKIVEAVKNRERIVKNKRNTKLETSSAEYDSGENSVSDLDVLIGSSFYDCCGKDLTKTNPKISYLGRTIIEREEDIYYPDQTNCEGEKIYGNLAGEQVRHHRFPDTAQFPHYVSKSVGVPSIFTPTADEYADGYCKLLGVNFSNIELPKDDELPKPLSKTNPYTIVYVKRTESNKTVKAKGLATKTYLANNNGKTYVFPRHAVNSWETVDRHIDVDGSRRVVNPTPHDSFNFFSLDTAVKKFSLNFSHFKDELELYGEGARHGLYAEGKKPDNQFYGTRIDQAGAREAVNLNKYVKLTGSETATNYKTYVRAHSVISPPRGGTIPLMNKYRESSVWVQGELPALTRGRTADSDDSFVGDVWDHVVPITNAAAHYITLYRDLPNQYGDLTGLTYSHLLSSTCESLKPFSSIQGICGDIYIGPYSFRRTGYVSDKVGDKFDIPGGQASLTGTVTKKEHRSVCDPPEDPIHGLVGNWVWTQLPREHDAADAKNYAGLHSPNNITRSWGDALGQGVPETDFYYPRVVKTLITFWGEFEVCPWLRATGNEELGEIYYPKLHDKFIDSNAPEKHPWEESFINRFYHKIEQPSKWSLLKKILIKSLINIVLPMLGIASLADIQTGTDFVGTLVAAPMLLAIWYVLAQVLFTGEFLDKIVGIDECKTDSEGGQEDSNIVNFEDNYHRYNFDYSKSNDIYSYFPMTDPYNTCICNNCDNFTTNEVYYSNKQIITSSLDAYKNFNGNNYFSLPADSGKLKKMFIRSNEFYAHTTDAIWKLQYANVSVPTSVGMVILGTGDLFNTPQTFMQGIPEGYAGIHDPNAAINSAYGYFFVDYDGEKLYQFTDTLKDISINGMFSFFKNNLVFNEDTACRDEKVKGSNYYSMGVDYRFNRLLFTKSEPGCGSYTLSYDFITEKWVSFHSYLPTFYLYDRETLYSSDGSKIHSHDAVCNYQTYYGNYYPCVLEFTSRSPETEIAAFEYKSTILNTEAQQCHEGDIPSLFKREGFNKIWLRNTHQTTGYLELVPRVSGEDLSEKLREKSNVIDMQWEGNHWRVNQLYDYTNDSNLPIVTSKCNNLYYPEPTNVSYEEALVNQMYKNRILFDNYLKYRLVFDKFASLKLYIKNILTYTQKITQ